MKGSVTSYNASDGIGIIHPDDDHGDVRFLRSSIIGKKSMPRDQRVEFELEHGPRGPEAVEVRRIRAGSRVGPETRSSDA
jgi:CspA family cold shock protein